MELLPDPKNNRKLPNLPPPPNKPLSKRLLWSDEHKSRKLISFAKLESIKGSSQTRRDTS